MSEENMSQKFRLKIQMKQKDILLKKQIKKVFFNWDSLYTKCEQPLQGIDLQEKEAPKDYSIQENCLEKTCS